MKCEAPIENTLLYFKDFPSRKCNIVLHFNLVQLSLLFIWNFRNVFGFSIFTHSMYSFIPPAENAGKVSILSARHYRIPIDDIDEALSLIPTAASWMEEANPIVYGSNLLILFLFLLLLKYTCMLFRWNVNRKTVFKIHIGWVEVLYASISSCVGGRTGGVVVLRVDSASV